MREQRAAPRFDTDCVCDLALGSATARVLIYEMSVHGCGVHVLDHRHDLPQIVGTIGLISVELRRERFTGMLPVRVRNVGASGSATRYGLQFCAVSPRVMKNILGLLDIICTHGSMSAPDTTVDPLACAS